MRRTGKLRYILLRGIATGAAVAGALIVVAWIKTEAFTLTSEALVGFVVAGLLGAAGARSDWNKFESIYPDVGNDPAGPR
jgi:hypothetical protein